MTDYRERLNYRPSARELDSGDWLTAKQAACIDETRLRDFGLVLVPICQDLFVATPIATRERIEAYLGERYVLNTAPSGHAVTVLRECDDHESEHLRDPDMEPSFVIQADDGWTGIADMSELGALASNTERNRS
jgi:hypothetical protein